MVPFVLTDVMVTLLEKSSQEQILQQQQKEVNDLIKVLRARQLSLQGIIGEINQNP